MFMLGGNGMSRKRQEMRRVKRKELHPERKPIEQEIIDPEEKAKRNKKAMNALANLMGISAMLNK